MSTKTIFNTLTALAVAATLTVGLAACAPQTAPAPVPVNTEKPAATEPAVEPITGDIDGDGKLSGWEREQLARANYTMPDGTAVPITRDGPLPAAVESVIKQEMAAKVDRSDTSYEAWVAAGFAARAVLEAESAKISRTIVPVQYVYDGMKEGFVWAVGGPAAGVAGQSETKEGAIALADGWVGANTEKFVVIAFD